LEREEIRWLRQLPLQERAAAGMRLVSQMYSDRVTGVWSAMLEAAASDEEVAAWCAEIEKGRHETAREFCEIIFQRPVSEQVLNVIWVLGSPDAYTKLATQRGWSRSMWENTMTEVIRRLITQCPAYRVSRRSRSPGTMHRRRPSGAELADAGYLIRL